MWLQTGSCLSWNTPVLPNDSKSWEQVRSFSCGNVAIQTFGSSKREGKCLILLNWNLKDCRKHRKQQLVEEKTDLFTVSRNFVLRIEFCSSKHIFWLTTGGQDKLPASATNTVHYYEMPSTHYVVRSYHPFIVCFIAHVGWEHWPSGQGCLKHSWEKSAIGAEVQRFVANQVTCPVKAGIPSQRVYWCEWH